ncbi:MAG: GTPase [Candidatus Hadarchaeales archaeon]
MPANLPPEYFKAEERYQRAKTLEEKIAATEELIRVAPKHKGAEKLLKTLKRRLSRLRAELEEKKARKSAGRGGRSFAVKREGAAQVALVGFPNSGKSWVLRKLTNARVEVADYPFTTTRPVPGMMDFEDIQVQIVEIPAIVEGSSFGRGLGSEPLSAARNSDIIAMVIDMTHDPLKQLKVLVDELEGSGIRINRNPPKITIKKTSSGGIDIKGGELVEGGDAEVIRILQEHRIHNIFISIEEPVGSEEIEDALDTSTVYRSAFVIATKSRDPDSLRAIEDSGFSVISADEDVHVLKKFVYEKLNLIRIYTKKPDEEPEKIPMVLPNGSTVIEVARKIHRDIEKSFNFARVWGSTKFPGQRVSRDYILHDKDIVELH